MMTKDSSRPLPKADLHTPEELLEAAQVLLSSGDPQVRRAVVLEAITALEAFVHRTVFGVLNRTMDALLVRWLDEKTRMDFDSRLSVLTPVALGQRVDKSSKLWERYKRAKDIRNKVTHSGKRVSREEATFVLETVRRWLAYLGSTAEVSLALDALKEFIESNQVPISGEAAAVRVVRDYFVSTRAAEASQEQALPRGQRADLVLTFGDYKVVVEVKLLRSGVDRIEQAVEQVASYVRQLESARGALIIFSRTTPPEAYRAVRSLREGLVSVVVIRVGS